MLASPAALTMVAGASIWQINAQGSVVDAHSGFDYNVTHLFDPNSPWAASDHNPEVVGLALPSPVDWNPNTAYRPGASVGYQGSTWQVLWYSRGTPPGDPHGAFEQILTAADGDAIWTLSRVFTAGEVVLYEPTGYRYVARWYSRNQAPGDVNGPWKLLG